jgi:hypothetical protein
MKAAEESAMINRHGIPKILSFRTNRIKRMVKFLNSVQYNHHVAISSTGVPGKAATEVNDDVENNKNFESRP